jgi:Tfp pilus assembly protein PilO
LLSDIEKEKELNSRMESKIGQIAEAQSLLADSKVSSRLGLLDQGLPADPKFGPLGDMLAAIVSESGLEIRTLNVGELQVEPKPETGGENNISGRVNFDLSARGNYAGIRKLVERLEEWRRVVEFKKVQITSASTGGGGELEVNISAAVGYVYEKK